MAKPDPAVMPRVACTSLAPLALLHAKEVVGKGVGEGTPEERAKGRMPAQRGRWGEPGQDRGGGRERHGGLHPDPGSFCGLADAGRPEALSA